MNNISVLKKYFPTGRAESEVDYLKNIFVPPDSYYDLITPDTRTVRIIVGKKGSGKSALLQYLNIKAKEKGIPSVLLRPDDMVVDGVENIKSIANIKSSLYKSLIGAIASRVGENLRGLIDEKDAVLIDSAVKDGRVEPSGLTRLLKILAPIGKIVSGVDFQGMLPEYLGTSSKYADAIGRVLRKDNKIFYLLIDDTDQLILPSQETYLECIWGLILAAQKIAEELPNIKVIISLKMEVWLRLSQDDFGARDQIDHFRPTIKHIAPDKNSLSDILKRRLRYCIETEKIQGSNEYEPFFKGRDCKLPTAVERRAWEDYLINSSRYRPRDTVQLIHHLAESCLKHTAKTRIDDYDVESSALLYSKERIEDLINENQYLCPELEVVLRSFKGVAFESDARDLFEHLKTIPGHGRITVKKNVMRSETSESDAFVIWKLLYDIEFLTPKKSDGSKSKGYRHVRPLEDATLVSKSRWNDMCKYEWDIQPSYRSFLKDLFDQDEKAMEGYRKKKVFGQRRGGGEGRGNRRR